MFGRGEGEGIEKGGMVREKKHSMHDTERVVGGKAKISFLAFIVLMPYG